MHPLNDEMSTEKIPLFWFGQMWLEMLPEHPNFGAVLHRMRGNVYAYGFDEKDARDRIAKYCQKYHLLVRDDITPIRTVPEDAPLSKDGISHARNAVKNGASIELFGVNSGVGNN